MLSTLHISFMTFFSQKLWEVSSHMVPILQMKNGGLEIVSNSLKVIVSVNSREGIRIAFYLVPNFVI